MLADIIVSGDLPLAERLARAATHESGHAVAALHYELPLYQVVIFGDGTGVTNYSRRLMRDEAEAYVITAFAGDISEHDLFYDRQYADYDDRAGIARMIQRLDLDWGERRLGALRFDAQLLVERLRPRIRAVAAALLQRRHLTAEDVARANRHGLSYAPLMRLNGQCISK